MEEQIIREAEFDQKYITYSVVTLAITLSITCVGLVFLPLLLPLTLFITKLTLKHLECDLTSKHLRLKTGALNRVEKTIPLDKITDMALVQGPIMRQFGIESLRIETAGSSQGALATIPAVINAKEFRDAVLAARDRFVDHAGSGEASSATAAPSLANAADGDEVLTVLKDIRDSLKRLEDK